MSENNLIMKSVRKDSSFIRYAVRLKKGACLFDDAENFLIKHGESIPRLVDKLLNNDFVSARRTDPEYPA